MERGTSVNIVTRLRVWRQGFDSQQGYFCLRHGVQTASEAQPASYPRDKAAGAWSWSLISI
jgi:hypothetical protein